ncbi:MAG: hypothetical protein ACRD2R_05765, partial [Terriglobales bacterium]
MAMIFPLLTLALAIAAGTPASYSSSAADQAQSAPAAALPADISGAYSFLKEGEYLQVNIEEGRVSGFVSRFGLLESDKGTFLDHFFEKASLEGNKF